MTETDAVDSPERMLWPALDHEELRWSGRTTAAFGREPHEPQRYRSAVPPFIAAVPVVVPDDLARRVISATDALVQFDARLGIRVANFAPVLLRSEAAASSQIEHVAASARRIFTADILNIGPTNALLIAANARAMQAALDLSDDLSATSILAMHDALLESEQHQTPGQWRQEPVWIGTSATSPVGADYVAAAQGRIPELIDDLVRFSRRDDMSPLVKVALAHAQFETIHPFTDGNGRTGRAYAQSMLRAAGITHNVAIPVSAGLLAHVRYYYEALTAYREGNPTPIIDAFAEAAHAAVLNATYLVEDIDTIRASWNTRLTARADSTVWRLLDVITRRPVLNAAVAAQELGIQLTNVYRHLNALTATGILKSKKEHLAGPFWWSEQLLDAIDAFADRSGRHHTTR